MRYFLIFCICSISFFSCDKPKSAKIKRLEFHKPVIKQSEITDSVKYLPSDSLEQADPIFLGKYKFTDSLFVSGDRFADRQRDSSIYRDFIDEHIVWRSDSLYSDGFELYPDYSAAIKYRHYEKEYNFYYPLYIVNQTPKNKIFIGKDSHVFGLQEARHKDGNWYPIEVKGYDFCGNGYWGLIVHPREFITVLLPKYNGDFETQIRIRLKIGDNTYVTKPFIGKINSSQFYLRRNDKWYLESLGSIYTFFYGTLPIQARNKKFSEHVVTAY